MPASFLDFETTEDTVAPLLEVDVPYIMYLRHPVTFSSMRELLIVWGAPSCQGSSHPRTGSRQRFGGGGTGFLPGVRPTSRVFVSTGKTQNVIFRHLERVSRLCLLGCLLFILSLLAVSPWPYAHRSQYQLRPLQVFSFPPPPSFGSFSCQKSPLPHVAFLVNTSHIPLLIILSLPRHASERRSRA